ncbi:MAG: cytochrome c oxidase assembly protein [Pseudomonadota bacterium]|nr:cytochrome c oxidase assembly protein [Pseudomonadota bacterium]
MSALRWLIPWDPSFAVFLVCASAGVVYARGCSRIACPLWRRRLFWAGLLSLYVVTDTGFDYYAEHSFFVHRLQHTVLHHVAPMLIILSQPAHIFLRGLPTGLTDRTWSLWQSRTVSALLSPALVTSLFVGLIGFWLVPSIHTVAMLDWRIYRVMNWSMALNGLAFWGLALSPRGDKGLTAGQRVAMMLGVLPPQIIIGAVILYASHELYPVYTLCGRAFVLDAATDQQLGGLVLWIMGSMMSVLGVLLVMRQELAARPSGAEDGKRPVT